MLKNRLSIALVALLASTAACAGTTTQSNRMAMADGGMAHEYVYVANQGAASVVIIDQNAMEVVETIDLQALGYSATSRPHHVAVEPDGSAFYVSLIGDNKVLKFNSDFDLVGEVDFERPGMMAIHPTRDILYVGRSMAAVNPPQRIGIVQRGPMEIDELDVFFPRPHAIAVDPDGDYLHVGSLGVNQFATIDAESDELTMTNVDGQMTHVFVQFAVSPDHRMMVATTEHTSKLLFFDISRRPEARYLGQVDVGAKPWHPTFSPDGRYVYFGNLDANTVTVVDAGRRAVEAVIRGDGLAEPHGIAVSRDGSKLFVSNRNTSGSYTGVSTPNNGTVVVIDTATREIIKVIEVGPYPSGIGVR